MLDVKRKAVSGILLILLLMSILTPAFNIQSVNSSEEGAQGTLEILTPSDGFTIEGAFDITFRITNTGNENIVFMVGDSYNRIDLQVCYGSADATMGWGSQLWSTSHYGLELAPGEIFHKTIECGVGVYEGDMTIHLMHWEKIDGYSYGSLGKSEIIGTITRSPRTGSPVIGFYRWNALNAKLADYLEGFGYLLKYVDQSNFMSCDLVFLDYRSCPPPEQDLLNYVNNGGNLWIDGEADDVETSFLGAIINPGVEFWGSSDNPSRLWLRDHQLTTGISLITYPAGGWIDIIGSIEDVIRIDGLPILAVDESHQGKILWLIDSDIFGNNFLYRSDNEVLAKNIADWLCGVGPQLVELEVDAYELSRSWTRDTTTDLPLCDIIISYSIFNIGREKATNIQISIKVDGGIFIQETISKLDAGENYIWEFSLPIPYDSSRHVEITASTSGFSNTHNINLEAILPRDAQNYGSLQKLYITPNDQKVQDILEIILSSYPFTYPDWMAIRDWVGSFVNYEADVDPGYYQLPQETIQRQIGDCEDYATLLVSLLRANGWEPETVYVVYGINSKGDAHAWVILKFGPIWYSLNPTSTMICTLIGDFLYLYDYKAIYMFNDVYYERIGLMVRAKSPVDIVVTDPDGLTISKQLNEIPEARYSEIDIDGDGDFDDQVVIMDMKLGDYTITLIPEPDASPTDTYTLEVSVDGTTTVLVDDVQISDIPAKPYIIRSAETEIIPIIPATIDFDPDTLALKSMGKWVTVYIELPVGHGYDVCDVSLEAILLNDTVSAIDKPTEIGDYDDDGIADLMVKFDRGSVIELIPEGVDGVTFTVLGKLMDGVIFTGEDTIKVVNEVEEAKR